MTRIHHFLLPRSSNNQRAKLLHSSSMGLIIGLFALFQLGLGQLVHKYPNILGYAAQISPAEIIRLTNIQRLAAGAPEVRLNEKLNSAAAQKAADMTTRDYWAHVSPIGTQPWYFITQAGYSYRYAGENLARDFSDPGSVVTAWMNSPSHRENLLNPKYEDIGIAVIDGTLGGKETTLVVQMFGTALTTAPAVARTAAFSVSASESKITPTISSELSPTANPEITVPIPKDTPAPELIATPPETNPSAISPFQLTRIIAQVLLGLLFVVLLIDVVLISHKKIVRWTSRSLAHLMFIAMLLIAMFTIIRGQIL